MGPLCLRTNKSACQAALTLRAYRLFDLRHFMCGSCHPPPHTPTTQRGMLYGLRHHCLPDAIIIYLHVLHAGFSIYRILSSDIHMCTMQLRKKKQIRGQVRHKHGQTIISCCANRPAVASSASPNQLSERASTHTNTDHIGPRRLRNGRLR